MKKSTIIYVFILFISKLSIASIIESTKSGNWKDSKTWINGIIPCGTDSVIINKSDTVYINSSFAKSVYLLNRGVIFFKSNTNIFNCNQVLFESGEITGNSPGSLKTETISFSGKSILGKCNLEVLKTLHIKDSLFVKSSSGIKTIGSLKNNGKLINIASENINLKGNFENNGEIIFNNGELIFLNPSIISGSLSLNKLAFNDSLIVSDSLTILEKISGEGKLINKGVLALGMNNSNLNIEELNLSFTDNEIHFIRNGQQALPKIFNNTAKKIIFSGTGTYSINNYLVVDSITINNESSLEITSKSFIKSILCKERAKLITSYGFNLEDVINLIFTKGSTLNINNNQKVTKSIQVGNLFIAPLASLTLNDSDTAYIGGDFRGDGILKGNPTIEYNGISRQFIKKRDYKKLIYNNTSRDSSTLYGNALIEDLKIKKGKLKIGNLKITKCKIDCMAQLIIGGHTPNFTDTLQISGDLIINSDYAKPIFYFLNIDSNGTYINNSDCDIRILSGISNNGKFSGCLGTACDYIFSDDSVFFSGNDTILISRMKAKKIYNGGILSITKKIITDSLFNLKNGTLILSADTQNISGIMDFNAIGNTIVFNKQGNQKSPTSLDHVHNITFLNNGSKSILSNLTISGNLNIEKQAILKTDSFQITGNSNGTLLIDSISTLIIGNNYSEKPIQFPLNFSTIYCHDSSLVIYASKGNQSICSKPNYGNLTLDDGSVSSSEKYITGDSLVINGNLKLSESSLNLMVNNKKVDLEGNWDGPGNVFLTTGKFHIGGDGNSKGKIFEGSSEFIYDGVKNQKIKIGNYYNLTIDKIGKASSKASTGSLFVKNKTWVKKGNLDFNSEKCDIINLIIDDSVSFSSKYQEKKFENIFINPSGFFILNYNEEIYVKGNIKCNGSFISNKGKIFFSDSLKRQTIDGSGEIKLRKIVICKKSNYLDIYCDATLTDTLLILNGGIELNSEIRLESLGYIKGESSMHPITGNGKISLHELIQIGTYENIKGLGISITSSYPMGITLIEREFIAHDLENKKGINRVYNIEPNNRFNQDVIISFNYWDSELNGNTEEELILFKSNDFGNTWKKEGGIVNISDNSINLSGIKSFSKLTAGESSLNILPAELLSFNAIRMNDDNDVLISWEVLSEIETEAYQIKYSFDGINFDSLTSAKATGQDLYEFTWLNAPSTTIYFQLIEVENFKKINFLDTVFIYPVYGKEPEAWVVENKIRTKNFPNGTLNVFDSRGKLIIKNSFDVSTLLNGVYYIELLNEISRWTYEFVK